PLTGIYTLSLHDALPILAAVRGGPGPGLLVCLGSNLLTFWKVDGGAWAARRPWAEHVQPLVVSVAIDAMILWLCVRLRESRAARSEEHTSELQSPCNLVC